MMPAHRVKLMSEGNTNEEFRDDATKTMASQYVRKRTQRSELATASGGGR